MIPASCSGSPSLCVAAESKHFVRLWTCAVKDATDATNAYISTSPGDTRGTESSFEELLWSEIRASGLFNIFLLVLNTIKIRI